MYCIVFSGRLLEGYDPQVVRQAVAARLQLTTEQVERLFRGGRLVLRKGLSEEVGRLQVEVLRRLGMDAGLVRSPGRVGTIEMHARFKVVFRGELMPGFALADVQQAAGQRFGLGMAGLERMFSGRKAVLKRGVSAEQGSRYVVQLGQLGMKVALEVEPLGIEPAPPAQQASSRHSVGDGDRPAGFRRHGDVPVDLLEQTQFELPTRADWMGADTADAGPEPDPALLELLAGPAKIVCTQCGHVQPRAVFCRRCGAQPDLPRPLDPVPEPLQPTPPAVVVATAPMLRDSAQDNLRQALREQRESDAADALPAWRRVQPVPLMLGVATGVVVISLWLA